MKRLKMGPEFPSLLIAYRNWARDMLLALTALWHGIHALGLTLIVLGRVCFLLIGMVALPVTYPVVILVWLFCKEKGSEPKEKP